MKRRNRFLLGGILITIILFVLELHSGILHYVIGFNNVIKENIYTAQTYIKNGINKHINQTTEINRLKQIELQKQEDDMRIIALQSDLDKIYSLIAVDKKPSLSNAILVEAYSYVNMGKYTQVWLKSDNLTISDENRVFGLVRNGFAAGIAVMKNGKLLGILNGDFKASYGVYIGESKSIGVVKNDINGNVVVEYINAWNEIKDGDEVITNGLDSIFFEGVKVGTIKNVRQEYGYIIADVDLYDKGRNIGYFWLIDVLGDVIVKTSDK